MTDSGTFKIPAALRLVKPEDTDPDPDSYGPGEESPEEAAYLNWCRDTGDVELFIDKMQQAGQNKTPAMLAAAQSQGMPVWEMKMYRATTGR